MSASRWGERAGNHRRIASDRQASESSHLGALHQEEMDEQLQHQHQQQHVHTHASAAPAPYATSAPPSAVRRSSGTLQQQDLYAARASLSAQDTLRRRTVASTPGNDSSNRSMNDTSSHRMYDEDSVGSESSYRFTGLEMPSTNNDLDTSSEHRAARFYKSTTAQTQRLNASMNNIGLGADGDLEEGPTRPRRSSFQPRRNARVRQKQSAPNRYYIANKNVQITSEWSSPTRQRRPRNSLTGQRKKTGEEDDTILVLPSISIPNGSEDYDPRSHHPSTIKPPSFPVRKTCVQASNILCTVGTFKWCILIQLIVVIPLCLYVFDAHAQKRNAKQQLQHYNEEHEHILNQMMWMDQAAKKMKAAHGVGAKQGELVESYYGADTGATDELRESVHKLRGQMRDMQYRIQQNSKARITEKYGEGTVRVYIHPEPEIEPLASSSESKSEELTSEIEIELFVEDTPHAVSTWLYQIERGHWNRVQMNWRGETSILSKPGSAVTAGMGDWAQTSRLEFLEKFPVKHCEVALVQEGQMGSLSLKINLVEVPFSEEEEVCIGRLVNDRLILPKSRSYFMAQFSTRSKVSESKREENMSSGGHDAKEKHEELHPGQQIVPPLEEPNEEAGDGL